MEPDGKTPRDQIRDGLSQSLTPEQVSYLVDEVLAIKKGAWADIECKSCKQKQRVLCEIPDARAVAGALKDLLAEGFGRPKDEPDDGEKIIFQRLVEFPDES